MASSDGQGSGTALPPLAQRLETIISVYYRNKKRPSWKEMAKEIEQATGRSFSGTYLWELATGRKQNVTADHLHTLAEFFGVTRDYFTDPEVSERVRRQLEFAVALGNSKVRTLAARADGLSDEHLDAILAVVRAMSNNPVDKPTERRGGASPQSPGEARQPRPATGSSPSGPA
jgi:transcriptional regulator with XRE-family HTH domain